MARSQILSWTSVSYRFADSVLCTTGMNDISETPGVRRFSFVLHLSIHGISVRSHILYTPAKSRIFIVSRYQKTVVDTL